MGENIGKLGHEVGISLVLPSVRKERSLEDSEPRIVWFNEACMT